MANTIGTIVAIDRAMLIGSMRPGCGSRLSGTRNGASASKGMSTGIARRNTEPHPKCSSRMPPTMGPRAAPAENIDAHTAIARRRWSRSVKMLRSRDNVEGMSMAPKNPIAARATISSSAVDANAASAEIAANPVAPMRSIRRRPNRSPIVPIVTSRPASTSG